VVDALTGSRHQTLSQIKNYYYDYRSKLGRRGERKRRRRRLARGDGKMQA
jgi:hypothetical protein